MIVKTKAFILSYLKYGDNSLIVKAYTEEEGFQSFIIKNSFSGKHKKNHFLIMLNEVELAYYEKANSLQLVKEIGQGYIFDTIHTDIAKSSILTFIGEILNQVLKKEELKDPSLYNFFKDRLNALDKKKSNYSDFHLCFLLELTRYIGFYPSNENSELPYFSLLEGKFSEKSDNLKENGSDLWKRLFLYDFSEEKNCFNSAERSRMLEEILSYYSIHLSNFYRPNSLEILQMVFS